jgi:AcrR family transcriptional regulator
MAASVNRRGYDTSTRRAAAEQTRIRVLLAARELFVTIGYANTSVADIARAASVSVDTLYAAVGRKPQLLLAVHDLELAGGEAPRTAEDREYVIRVRAARTAREKIEIYTTAMAQLLPVTVPLLESLRVAGITDRECQKVYDSVSERRAANMQLFAADLRSTGELRDDLSNEDVAHLMWSMNSSAYFLLMRSRGKTAEQYAEFIRDVWVHTLLRTPQVG